jgi:hypothetical protein|tara:strand:- start:399 stop:623 length:225 start_codon:yes stop_codon:yes gene_type:complete
MNPINKIVDIERFHHLKVKYVVDRPPADPLLDAILNHACNGRTDWNVQEWNVIIQDIRESELTVGEYLEAAINE